MHRLRRTTPAKGPSEPAYHHPMGVLLFLARAFIDTFGITHPTPKQERRAAWFIAALLFAIAAGILAILCGFLFVTHR